MNVVMKILIKNKPIENFLHEGKYYVEGREGSEFEIEIVNANPKRVLAIVSVDGLSVLDGQEAGDNSPGYMVPAYGTIRIPGWKVDGSTAAKFLFGGKSSSYAVASSGKSVNCGIIGALIYEEKPAPITIKGVMRGSIADSYLSASGSSSSWGGIGGALGKETSSITYSSNSGASSQSLSTNNLGTGFGKATDFATTEVQFEKGDLLDILSVQYDDKKGLEARGIVVRPKYERQTRQPNAFPAGTGCKPPRGWTGR